MWNAERLSERATQGSAWWIVITVVWIGCAASSLLSAEPDATDLDSLIRQLGSSQFSEREGAAKELEAIGEPALKALRKARDSSSDIEIRRRARLVSEVIEAHLSRELRCFAHEKEAVQSVAFLPDGKRALAGISYGTLALWELQTGKQVLRLQEGGSVLSVAVSPNGCLALSAHDNGEGRSWELETGKVHGRFESERFKAVSVALSPDGKQALSGGFDGTLRLWNVETGQELLRVKAGRGNIGSIAFSPDGRRALSGCYNDESICLWDLAGRKELRRFEGHTRGVAFSPDGRRALAGDDSCIHLWDLESGNEARRFAGHDGMVLTVAFSADGKKIVSGGVDKTVRCWDAETGKELRCFRGHTASVTSVAISPDSMRALSGSDDKTMRLWNLPKN